VDAEQTNVIRTAPELVRSFVERYVGPATSICRLWVSRSPRPIRTTST